MSSPEVIRWNEPTLEVDEETDESVLSLGSVIIPPHIDEDTVERVFEVVTELVNQMIEEDILPELLSPETGEDYSGDLLTMEDDDSSPSTGLYIRDGADALEDDFDDCRGVLDEI